jgi:glycosyltransferase involved in cell wall biosynthesis
MKKVTVVAGGHLATCPRMLKAADALHESGYAVRVISTVNTPWAAAADRELHARRNWAWETIDYTRHGDAARWLVSGLRMRASLLLARGLNGHSPGVVASRALGRVHPELVDAILREPADVIYGGQRGAIAAVVEASRRSGTPCGVDFEDFHCGEDEPAEGALRDDLSAAVMAEASRYAAFVTAGSAAIADACEAKFGIRPTPIDNVFRLPLPPILDRAPGPLRLYWFSQSIGPGRGLEDVVDAAGEARLEIELHLRGVSAGGYVPELRARAARTAPSLWIDVHAPGDPDRMIDSCRGFDAGISAEQGHIPNRQINLPNKALTYPLAGLALVLTDTKGHRPLAADLGGEGIVYEPGRHDALAEGLARWSNPRDLRRAREAAWEAARRRWHWEHPLEREALLACVAKVVS